MKTTRCLSILAAMVLVSTVAKFFTFQRSRLERLAKTDVEEHGLGYIEFGRPDISYTDVRYHDHDKRALTITQPTTFAPMRTWMSSVQTFQFGG
jgi:hypothetical protein